MVKILLTFIGIFVFCSNAIALTTITNSTTFPYSATTNSETYQLSEDITCDGTCIVVSGDNVIIDLNTYTMTYGNANAVTVINSDFENWTGNVPDNWTVVSGSVSSISAIDWGNYDLSASDSFTIRSDSFTLTGGKTYQAWAFVKGGSEDSFTLKILDASDDSVLDSYTYSGNSRGFATSGNETSDTVMDYKPVSGIDVKLELVCTGTSTWVVPEVNMAPTNDYGIVSYSYQNTNYFPDLSSSTFGFSPGLEVKNGTITQGNGNGSYSFPIRVSLSESGTVHGDGTFKDLTINYSGPNNTGIWAYGKINNLLFSNIDVNITSTRVFNRMYGTAGVHILPTEQTGDSTLSDVNVYGAPEYGILIYNNQSSLSGYGTTEISGCNIKNKGVVGEPYGIGLSGVHNLKIHDNVIETESPGDVTRGILFDAVVGDNFQGCSGDIYDNIIRDVWENANLEYYTGNLSATGIRIRNWGDSREDHVLNIYRNTIITSNTATSSIGTKGIAINTSADGDNVNIYDNTITVSKTEADDYAIGISLQGIDTTNGGQIYIHNNEINSNDIGVQFGSNDGSGSIGVQFYSNTIQSTGGNVISFYSYMGGYLYKDNNIYCNKATYSGGAADGYPFKLDGDFSTGNYVSNNLITNNNSGGYEVWADENESSNITFCANGTIDVTGGGSVGSASAPCQDGSLSCYDNAGVRLGLLNIISGSQSISWGSGDKTISFGN